MSGVERDSVIRRYLGDVREFALHPMLDSRAPSNLVWKSPLSPTRWAVSKKVWMQRILDSPVLKLERVGAECVLKPLRSPTALPESLHDQ